MHDLGVLALIRVGAFAGLRYWHTVHGLLLYSGLCFSTSCASLSIAFGMLAGTELAFVVIDIAYVQHHIFTDEVFCTLMFTVCGHTIPPPGTFLARRLLQSFCCCLNNTIFNL